jgi:hypothetical protein
MPHASPLDCMRSSLNNNKNKNTSYFVRNNQERLKLTESVAAGENVGESSQSLQIFYSENYALMTHLTLKKCLPPRPSGPPEIPPPQNRFLPSSNASHHLTDRQQPPEKKTKDPPLIIATCLFLNTTSKYIILLYLSYTTFSLLLLFI